MMQRFDQFHQNLQVEECEKDKSHIGRNLA